MFILVRVQFSVIYTKPCGAVLLGDQNNSASPWTGRGLDDTLLQHLFHLLVDLPPQGKRNTAWGLASRVSGLQCLSGELGQMCTLVLTS